MRSTVALLLSFAALAAGPARASEISAKSARALERRATAKMTDLDYEAAVPLLQRALRSSALPGEERARLEVELGVAFVNLGKDGNARAAFSKALELDPKAALPSDASPKIQGLFEEAQRALAPPPPPPPPPPPVQVAPPPPLPPPVVELPRAVPPASVAAAPAGGSRSLAAPIGIGVGAVVALGVGIWAAEQSQGAAVALQSGLNSRSTVDGLVSRQGTFATVSIVSYVVAGLAAVAGVTLFAVEGSSGSAEPERHDATFSGLGPTPLAFSF